ncbi:glycosyltransferase family 2 protein [Riemerella columbina]|uniref:glycosyltransferase family 2 protein n=1 Tax=Riemerella columbina TaxID=103810 RepID=UPI0026700F29|nr:glycosyltransferase [Riemerella columbina]WKS95141.1 glycosyltransferase [Riemerella columbina]
MHNPLISVVMSVYNAEKYLAKAIDSILNQTYNNFEFIIIEDCSSDGSLEIIKEYAAKDNRIKILQKKENKGTRGFIENLNWGIQSAKGKYIARMDADDISHLQRFEKQVQYLEQNPEVFIVGAHINFIDEEGKIIGEKKAPITPEQISYTILKSIPLFHPVIMFRNEAVHYRENIWYCEDYELYLRLMTEGKIMTNLDEKLLDYRLLTSSISRKGRSLVKYMFLNKAFQMYHERLKEGKDSYKSLNPDDYANILNLDYKNEWTDLKIAAEICVKNQYKEDLKIIIKKRKQLYPAKNLGYLEKMSLLPDVLFSITSKIYKRI